MTSIPKLQRNSFRQLEQTCTLYIYWLIFAYETNDDAQETWPNILII